MTTGARIAIAVVAILCALGFGGTAFAAPDAFPNPTGIYICALVCLLIAVSCLTGPAGRAVRRVLAGLVAILYVAYVVKELAAPQPVLLSGSRSKPSIVNALAGLVLIGGPCALYAIFGNRLVDWFRKISTSS